VTLSAFLAASGPAPAPWPDLPAAAVVIVRGRGAPALDIGRRVLAACAAAAPGVAHLETTPAAQWPFHQDHGVATPVAAPWVAWVPDLHDAFVNAQTNATRLVTTQAAYLLAVWTARLRQSPGSRLVATADPDVLARHAEDAAGRRGPWRGVAWIDAPPDETPPTEAPLFDGFPAAFRAPDPATRLTLAGRALDRARTPAHLAAMASACMEDNDLDNAGALLDAARRAAPQWPAAAFEHGKYWLRKDDIAAAADAFGAAAAALPGFASAAANWGATLGELDRPDEAVGAFAAALEADPDNAQVHNNVGVVLRELGRLGDAEAAFRRAVALTPGLAFGHYNLGHTLFLQGRYQGALAAYEAGQRLDPARNPVQASRLALARLAAGDAAGALRDLRQCTAGLPRDYRRQILADAQSVAWALLSAAPDLRDWRVVGDWIAAELAKG
jgi:tetratricopeptide (TPR) repeat protein